MRGHEAEHSAVLAIDHLPVATDIAVQGLGLVGSRCAPRSEGSSTAVKAAFERVAWQLPLSLVDHARRPSQSCECIEGAIARAGRAAARSCVGLAPASGTGRTAPFTSLSTSPASRSEAPRKVEGALRRLEDATLAGRSLRKYVRPPMRVLQASGRSDAAYHDFEAHWRGNVGHVAQTEKRAAFPASQHYSIDMPARCAVFAEARTLPEEECTRGCPNLERGPIV